MDKQQLAKIIENLFPQLYLNKEGWDLEWGKKVFISLDGDNFEYITYNTGGRGGILGRFIII